MAKLQEIGFTGRAYTAGKCGESWEETRKRLRWEAFDLRIEWSRKRIAELEQAHRRGAESR